MHSVWPSRFAAWYRLTRVERGAASGISTTLRSFFTSRQFNRRTYTANFDRDILIVLHKLDTLCSYAILVHFCRLGFMRPLFGSDRRYCLLNLHNGLTSRAVRDSFNTFILFRLFLTPCVNLIHITVAFILMTIFIYFNLMYLFIVHKRK